MDHLSNPRLLSFRPITVWIFPLTLVVLMLSPKPFVLADEGIAFFEQKIRPVLIEHCYECHSVTAAKRKGNLLLDSKAGIEAGGDSGETLIRRNDPDGSYLIRVIKHAEVGVEMPPSKAKLPDAVIADFVSWVKMGAPDPRTGVVLEAKRADKSWWSLQPLKTDFEHENVDDFIHAQLSEKNLSQNLPADPRTLLRRMTYDVTGLPPSYEEVVTFEKQYEKNPQEAVANLVEYLLASPRYGERWGRHWLDVIRFGESHGFERNVIVDDLWPFRDYVIQSINDDKSFQQLITEHLAGDVVGKDNPSIEVGTAFLVAGPYDDVGNQDAVAKANIRAATLDDIITATCGAFLGLTVNCARCHHHKFDPIPTEDYYRMLAAFEGVTHARRSISTREERQAMEDALKPLNAELKQLESERASMEAAIEARAKTAYEQTKSLRPKIDLHGTDESFDATEAKYLKFIIHGLTSDYQDGPKAKRRGGQGGKLTEFRVWSADQPEHNVALATHGTIATGAKSTTAEDFPEAYGPQYCIDGALGEAWFIGSPPELTLTFPRVEKIHRITFLNARGDRSIDDSKVRGSTPCEYEVQVSVDGKQWKTVASDDGREPWTPAHGIAKSRREMSTDADEKQLADLDKRIQKLRVAIGKIPKLPQVWAGTFATPKEQTFVRKGGDPMKLGEPIAPASLQVLSEIPISFELKPNADEGERRLALAKWITDDNNPLSSRVLANRVWQYHFGTGIVDSPSDFGFQGSKPTHPELLDYLANRLIKSGWKLKTLHREILLSKTYQQSAVYHEAYAKLDKDARLLWRFPTRRLSAEELRDTMLTVAGKMRLDPMGGPGFRLYKFTQNNVCTYIPLDVHGADTYRRSVYHQNARASVVDVLSDYDLPDNAFAAPKRANTTTPLQALTLLNHSFTLDMAKAISDRLQSDGTETASDSMVVTKAYRYVLQRDPSQKELVAATHLVTLHGTEAFCRALLNANELVYIE